MRRSSSIGVSLVTRHLGEQVFCCPSAVSYSFESCQVLRRWIRSPAIRRPCMFKYHLIAARVIAIVELHNMRPVGKEEQMSEASTMNTHLPQNNTFEPMNCIA